MILIFRDGFRIELQRIGDFDGISSMCTQKQFCVIKIIKIIDRISGTEFDSFDLLQIDKKSLLHRRRLSAEFETIECFF